MTRCAQPQCHAWHCLSAAQVVTARGEEIEALLQRLSDVNDALSRRATDRLRLEGRSLTPKCALQHCHEHRGCSLTHTGAAPRHPARVHPGESPAPDKLAVVALAVVTLAAGVVGRSFDVCATT